MLAEAMNSPLKKIFHAITQHHTLCEGCEGLKRVIFYYLSNKTYNDVFPVIKYFRKL